MAYAQFMVGAHDTADNPNYNMFNLARREEWYVDLLKKYKIYKS